MDKDDQVVKGSKSTGQTRESTEGEVYACMQLDSIPGDAYGPVGVTPDQEQPLSTATCSPNTTPPP